MDQACDASPRVRTALFDLVRRHTGIHMAERKWTMLQGRLRRRLRMLELDDWNDYLAVLGSQSEEVDEFIDLVTTNETSFFRTPRIWDHLWQVFLPGWFAQHRGATLQIWSAAASTGEEAYSMAMLCEEFRALQPAFKYRILATDIASRVLVVGTAGRYRGRSIDGLRRTRPAWLEKYFRVDGDACEVSPTLRAAVTFRRHDLYQPLETGKVDLVLLRNVLIYFDEDGQREVLAVARRAMAPGGVLVVGESESLHRLQAGFAFEQPSIYRKEAA